MPGECSSRQYCIHLLRKLVKTAFSRPVIYGKLQLKHAPATKKK